MAKRKPPAAQIVSTPPASLAEGPPPVIESGTAAASPIAPSSRRRREQHDPARWMYERLVRSIEAFEKTLTQDQEIGARMVATPGEDVFHVENVGYWSPDLIVFHGHNRDGRSVHLIQHYTMVSLLLTSMPRANPSEDARRIGFDLVKRIEDEKWADPVL